MTRPAKCSFSIAMLTALVVATSVSGGTPVTDAQYRAMLKAGSARVAKAEAPVESAVQQRKPAARVKTLLLAWANTETALGKSFKAIIPPAKAAKANALLARGEILFGAQLTAAADSLPQKPAAIGAYLEKRLANATGARMIDEATAMLKKAGYG